MQDEQLTGARQGDEQRMEELLKAFRPLLRRYAAGILGNKLGRRADTSDLIQETMTRAFSRMHQFRGQNRAEFFGWLKAIVRNEAVRIQRFHTTEKRNVTLDISSQIARADDAALDPGLEAADQENLICIAVALEALPRVEREVVRRRSFKSQSFAEIAVEMDRSSTAVKALWSRGIRRLRRIMATDPSSTSC